MMDRQYVAIDLKSFYASVECFERGLNPLTARLVVADESRTDKTICLAVSPALKAYGISGRARLFEVKARLAEIKRTTGEDIDFIIAPPRMARYIEFSNMVYNTYLKYIAPEDIHVYSIDEVFIDVTGYLKTYKMTAHELTIKMIRDVLSVTGITATAGIGTNLYLAKIAMDITAKHMEADEDGVRIAELNERTYREQLWDHKPITDFWRIGGGTARRLAANHMYTMGDIARKSITDEERLYQIFGIDAEFLIDHAWGIEPTTIADIKNYKPSTNSLSSGQVLSTPYTIENAKIIIREMTEALVLDLVKQHLVSNSFTLDIMYDRENVDNGTYTGEIQVDRYGRLVPKHSHGTANFMKYTSSTDVIINSVLETYDRIVNPELTVRRLNISANDLKNEDDICEQYDIFTDPEKLEQEKRLQNAMLEIKDKFGKNAILKGTSYLDAATARDRNGFIGGHKG
ncbi:MAG: DNA methylase [Eubacterium sp.]|nr:DNA methylase [Eubacterium sp.]